MSLSAYTVTPRQARKYVVRCMMAHLVPFIQGSPAIGKSAIVRAIAKEYNLALIDHRLSTSAPEDLSGLPRFREDGVATFAPFDTFPTDDMPLPEGKDGWILFLDEFNSASKMVQAAAYKLVLDRGVGQKKLHPRVVLVAAGNLSTDRAIVNPISTAMQSRLIHLTMELDFNEFMEDVAFPQKWDSRIIAYLNYKRSALHDFRPDHNEKTFCSPRTWEFVNRLITGQDVRDEDAALYAGAITSGVAVDFINFTKVYDSLPKFSDIARDPEGTDVPIDSATRWATVMHLVENVADENFDSVATYINRLTAEFRVLFFRVLMTQKPELKMHSAFRRAMVELSRYLHDDIPTAA
jgi:MoxR-like ATPase